MQRSKEAIGELEILNRSLKESRAVQVNEFNHLENRMHASNIIDALFRLREVINSSCIFMLLLVYITTTQYTILHPLQIMT